MRRDNALFFIAGLAFGVAIGYFVVESVRPISPPAGTSVGASSGEASDPARASARPRSVIDPSAMAALEKRASENPGDVEVRVQMGTMYLEAGRYQEALRVLGEARPLAPSNLHLRNHYALAFENLDRYDEAAAEYEAILAVDARYPDALLGLGRVKLYHKRDIRGGIELWEKLLQVAPESEAARSVRDELEALKSAHPAGG